MTFKILKGSLLMKILYIQEVLKITTKNMKQKKVMALLLWVCRQKKVLLEPI